MRRSIFIAGLHGGLKRHRARIRSLAAHFFANKCSTPARSSRSYPVIRRAGAFCINVLTEDQRELCDRFARRGADKWRRTPWTPAPSGSPVLEGVLAWIDCRLEAEYETGDHFLIVGRVMALEAAHARPLLYFRGGFANLHPEDGRGETAPKRAARG